MIQFTLPPTTNPLASRPGGRFILSQSNRLFYTKAVARWLALDDLSRLELIGDYFNTITTWLSAKKFQLPKVNLYEMDEVALTHELIQSGKSIGKIVVRTNKNEL